MPLTVVSPVTSMWPDPDSVPLEILRPFAALKTPGLATFNVPLMIGAWAVIAPEQVRLAPLETLRVSSPLKTPASVTFSVPLMLVAPAFILPEQIRFAPLLTFSPP